MNKVGVFPFGQPVLPVVQTNRSKKRVFVLGVYASAVHARWVDDHGCQRIGAVAVASEPEIFWRGNPEEAQAIIARIELPSGAGALSAANSQLNGPSGQALDDLFLTPLHLQRADAWLCDLVPHSCMNEKQAAALRREYDPIRDSLGLPQYDWPLLPTKLTNEDRQAAIEEELRDSGADILITLGDQPLRWFTRRYGTKSQLAGCVQTTGAYGRPLSLTIGRKELQLLPLVHPRQAARLGTHSAEWASHHDTWVRSSPDKWVFA